MGKTRQFRRRPLVGALMYFLVNTRIPCWVDGETKETHPVTKVTSGEFILGFGRYRVMAHCEPVGITNHGRDDVVLIGAEDYARLRRYDQKTFHVTQLLREVVDELGTLAIPEEASRFDHE